ncbi:MAG: hypothetical protein WC216_11125, partial [Gallionella sp.]
IVLSQYLVVSSEPDKTTDKTTQFWLRAKAQAIIDSHSTDGATKYWTKTQKTASKPLLISCQAGFAGMGCFSPNSQTTPAMPQGHSRETTELCSCF